MEEHHKIITHPDGSRLAFFSLKGSEPGIIFFSGYKSDMNGTKACSIEGYCKEKNISFTKFDYFGHGESDGDFENGTISRWLEDSLIVFDNITLGKQILIGSSMGAWIMLLVANQRKKRVSGIIGIAPAPDFTKFFLEDATLQIKNELKNKGIFWQDSDYSEQKTPITSKFIIDSKKFYILKKNIFLDCPVRLIHGLKDRDVSYRRSIELGNKISSENLSYYFFPEGDHRLSKPKEIKKIIKIIEEIL
ncbi:MAG: hypothetical protein CFH01_00635 [Alphaproteobacteria bacterium MarineAlpha2_Bin1]|nr:MAG: hypothetical protein CFH01_00635 [Alphaproteobacteria bacterium MarineAlpha2_Bin1]